MWAPEPPRPRSHAAFERARALIPGGVNSPARAFGAVGGEPPFVAPGEGPFLVDLDDNRYIDYVGPGGPPPPRPPPPPGVAAGPGGRPNGGAVGAPPPGGNE